MPEILLQPNRRALYVGMALPLVIAAFGLFLALGPAAIPGWIHGLGWGLVAVGGLLAGLLFWQTRQPRLAYEAGRLLVYLRIGPPIRVPIEVVECCFLSAGPTLVRGAAGRGVYTANLVLRVAERASDWTQRAVKPALGKWADGYITIHGAWCEPLTADVVQRLNTRLHELNRQQPITAATPADSDSGAST